jgi:hypothetical protein
VATSFPHHLQELAMTSSFTSRSLIATVLAAVALAAAAAQPAAADSAAARFYGSTDASQTSRWCEVPWAYGYQGAYGAWGFYIDGCTASVTCPWWACRVMQATGIVEAYYEVYATCNSAVRILSTSGSLRYRADYSSSSSSGHCRIDRSAPYAYYGERVTVQTNGVVARGPGLVRSSIWLAPA